MTRNVTWKTTNKLEFTYIVTILIEGEIKSLKILKYFYLEVSLK